MFLVGKMKLFFVVWIVLRFSDFLSFCELEQISGCNSNSYSWSMIVDQLKIARFKSTKIFEPNDGPWIIRKTFIASTVHNLDLLSFKNQQFVFPVCVFLWILFFSMISDITMNRLFTIWTNYDNKCKCLRILDENLIK